MNRRIINQVVAIIVAIAGISYRPLIAQTNQIPNTMDLTVTRIFDAPVDKVWKYWAESEYVRKWWGPTNFTCPLAELDFKEGGVSLVCMRSPDGFEIYNTWTYSKIVPMQRIEFTLNFADRERGKLDPAKIGMPPGIPIDVPHVITFQTMEGNKTQMTVMEYGYTNSQIVEVSKAGLNQSLDKLEQHLKGL